MRKSIFLTLLATTINASAFNLDLDNSYLTSSILTSSYGQDVGADFNSPTGYAIQVGIPYLFDNSNIKSSLELGYSDLGEANGKVNDFNTNNEQIKTKMDISATSLYVVNRFNFDVTDNAQIYMKVGINSLNVKGKGSYEYVRASLDEDGINPIFSLGSQYTFYKKIGLGFDYTAYSADISALSINLRHSL